ncbi:MAG: isoprenylcysteine carboxylmethyltransferase family protein [Nitrospinae bacterium]|nr:isoprenylcysteine carboxylmethyltransferase family protein [Nitrospinota bacterium]
MKKTIFFIYGVAAYVVFFGAFLHSVGFVGNLVLSKTIDTGPEAPLTQAILIDLSLLGLFAIQHSVMARMGFKKWWTRIVPEQVERSTFVLISSLLLFLLFWQWRPMTGEVWNIEDTLFGPLLSGLFWIGWLIVLFSTFMIDHFDLFGLRQVYLYLRDKENTPVEFKTPALYKYVRHPVMSGFIIAFWAAPKMTLGHLLFAAATTVYILIAIQLEERDLRNIHGEAYENYSKRVSMLFLSPGKKS